jgi:hypothetical protein
MSGQPNKTENDIIRHKNEYIESLNLQTAINKQNYDANKLYKETGQVMPIIALTDNRSIEDKLLDIEKLKQDIAKTIGTISSLTFGTNVVQAIMENPVNVDNKLLIFTAQRINEIILNLKKIYAIGIKGDKNDIQQLVNFILKMYSDANAFTKTAKNFVDSQPSGALNPIGGPNLDSLQGVKNTLERILPLIGTLSDEFNTRITNGYPFGLVRNNLPMNIENFENEISTLFQDIFNFMTLLNYLILSREQVARIVDVAKNQDYGLNGVEEARYILNFMSKIFPNPNVLYAFWDKNKKLINILENFDRFRASFQVGFGGAGVFDQAIASSYKVSLENAQNLLLKLLALLNPDGITLIDLQQYITIVDYFFQTYGMGNQVGGAPPIGAIAPVGGPPPVGPPAGGPVAVGGAPVGGAPVGGAGAVAGAPIVVAGPAGQMANQQQWDNYVVQHVIGLTDVQLNALYFAIPNTPYLLHVAPLIGQGMFGNANASRNEKEQSCIQALRLQYNNPAYGPQAGIGNLVQGAVGLGISKEKRRRGRPKGNGIMKPYSETVKQNLDLTRGIEPTGKFIKFGKYLLNSHKLNKENIFSLKHISGGNIIDIPSTRLTEDLGKVIKTIVGGGNPSFNDLSKLSEPEQNYLHKICSKSNIIDKLTIPTPSKDSEEKEIHKFEVMKGEIASGNDSPELIKEFKRMILKLQKNNSLPKKEVYEILEELNVLGY